MLNRVVGGGVVVHDDLVREALARGGDRSQAAVDPALAVPGDDEDGQVQRVCASPHDGSLLDIEHYVCHC
jgi:hypothetical protein